MWIIDNFCTCNSRNCFFSSWFMTFTCLSFYWSPSPRARVRYIILTFCWCCLAFFVYFYILLRLLNYKKKIQMNKNYFSMFQTNFNNSNRFKLNPYFITGLTESEGSFLLLNIKIIEQNLKLILVLDLK